ncbi:DMT family transporter [Sulfuriflexus mobilis]|uniref:DMT family transporter n=1 Tax=Sulfuriflexus mobilis TaxID=1811807 RepID=UPI000F822419|nr:DMT family transporter [Sulfuriflexus mobilis]
MGMGMIISFAIVAGGLVAIQGAVNSQLGTLLSHPLQAAFISFLVGTLGLWIMVLILNESLPQLSQLKAIPIKLYVGGLLGAAFITATIVLIPKIGVANMLIAALIGQILGSLVLDHFGLFGVPQKPIEISRMAGAGCVVLGLYFINK